ncbi:nucleotide exchange factor GrpE [Aquipuribacter nitratireducens]|uniref:Protein GrpE n=1 Tax=Aquipuribacter nitratireducens TaxID=650104 RepID=A0ABW0GNA6_9MICO
MTGQPEDSVSQPGSDVPAPAGDDLAAAAEAVDQQEAVGTDHPGPDESVAAADEAAARAEGGLPPVDGPERPAGEGSDPLGEALALADARLQDLQRERADFVNYRRRVERDREQAGQEARAAVLAALLPVLDDVEGARQHGDLTGPFAAVADKLTATLQRLGLEAFGEAGEPFDPSLHEALLQDGQTEVDVPTCTQVLQRGYRTGERVLRPARVAVATPA